MLLHVTTLRSIRWLLLAVLLFALGSVGRIQAQPKQGGQVPQPRIQVVSPAGGKAGTSFDVLVTGQGLEMPQGLLFSHAGIKAELIETTVVKNDPQKKAAAPVVQQAVRFKVTVDPATPIGTHDLRFVNGLGVSNPRAFRGRRPGGRPGARAEQRCGPGPARRGKSRDPWRSLQPRGCRLLRLSGQEGPARRRQLPRFEHRQPGRTGAAALQSQRCVVGVQPAATRAATPC